MSVFVVVISYGKRERIFQCSWFKDRTQLRFGFFFVDDDADVSTRAQNTHIRFVYSLYVFRVRFNYVALVFGEYTEKRENDVLDLPLPLFSCMNYVYVYFFVYLCMFWVLFSAFVYADILYYAISFCANRR